MAARFRSRGRSVRTCAAPLERARPLPRTRVLGGVLAKNLHRERDRHAHPMTEAQRAGTPQISALLSWKEICARNWTSGCASSTWTGSTIPTSPSGRRVSSGMARHARNRWIRLGRFVSVTQASDTASPGAFGHRFRASCEGHAVRHHARSDHRARATVRTGRVHAATPAHESIDSRRGCHGVHSAVTSIHVCRLLTADVFRRDLTVDGGLRLTA